MPSQELVFEARRQHENALASKATSFLQFLMLSNVHASKFEAKSLEEAVV
jgi:hypothetical protein